MEILLGSNSPRRNELLTQMDINFTKVSITCDEDFDEKMLSSKVPLYLSQKKSKAYTSLNENQLLVTADTVVINGDTLLNKPSDAKEAEEMLRSLSGKSHDVITGVTLRTHSKEVSFSSTTRVWLDKLMPADIDHYIANYKPYDKAGSYGIQEWFGLSQVNRIEGCFYNVVGLPCSLLYKRLKNDYNAF
jgi:septum formation protein